jgi:hypothetical protein
MARGWFAALEVGRGQFDHYVGTAGGNHGQCIICNRTRQGMELLGSQYSTEIESIRIIRTAATGGNNSDNADICTGLFGNTSALFVHNLRKATPCGPQANNEHTVYCRHALYSFY